MAVYLTRICICRAGLVYQVFQTLDRYSTFDVVCRFAAKINKSSLYALAATRDGLILCKSVFDTLRIYRENRTILNGIFLPPSCEGTDQTTQLFENVVNNPTPPKDENLEPRQLSECEMDFFTERGSNQTLWMKRGKLVIRKLSDPLICWDLPTDGVGFTTYRIDDLKRQSLGDLKYGYDQIGTKETVEAMVHIAREWFPLHTDRKMQYGDMSRPGGINTPDHGGHKDGKTFDIRPLRNDTLLEGLELKVLLGI